MRIRTMPPLTDAEKAASLEPTSFLYLGVFVSLRSNRRLTRSWSARTALPPRPSLPTQFLLERRRRAPTSKPLHQRPGMSVAVPPPSSGLRSPPAAGLPAAERRPAKDLRNLRRPAVGQRGGLGRCEGPAAQVPVRELLSIWQLQLWSQLQICTCRLRTDAGVGRRAQPTDGKWRSTAAAYATAAAPGAAYGDGPSLCGCRRRSDYPASLGQRGFDGAATDDAAAAAAGW